MKDIFIWKNQSTKIPLSKEWAPTFNVKLGIIKINNLLIRAKTFTVVNQDFLISSIIYGFLSQGPQSNQGM